METANDPLAIKNSSALAPVTTVSALNDSLLEEDGADTG